MRADAQANRNRLLEIAAEVVAEHGVDASMRDIARKADVGLATLLRHFPSRDALLDALLRADFDELTARAAELAKAESADDALVTWLRSCVGWTAEYRGVAELMAAAIEDSGSALHASCVSLRESGTRLLERAKAEGSARGDFSGDDLFALAAALAWLAGQPPLVPRADHLFEVLTDALFAR